MKVNIANPDTGLQKKIEFEDETKVMHFFGRRIGETVDGDNMGAEFAGYRFTITGGNDKQGFPMLPGVLTHRTVRLLLKKGMKCYRPRRDGERRRKLVRGCIVSNELSTVSLKMIKKGDQEIPGLTDGTKPSRLGPKRAGRIRKHFGLVKGTDLRPCVARREITDKKGRKKTKAPKIQRLVTTQRVLRKKWNKKRRIEKLNATRDARKEYETMMEKYQKSRNTKLAAAKAAPKAKVGVAKAKGSPAKQ